jgi:hypothetical protein
MFGMTRLIRSSLDRIGLEPGIETARRVRRKTTSAPRLSDCQIASFSGFSSSGGLVSPPELVDELLDIEVLALHLDPMRGRTMLIDSTFTGRRADQRGSSDAHLTQGQHPIGAKPFRRADGEVAERDIAAEDVDIGPPSFVGTLSWAADCFSTTERTMRFS